MDHLGRVTAIWRYPVKSLAAQPLAEARLESNGIPGDRHSALFVRSGHARIGKTYRGKENNLLHTASDASRAVQIASDRNVDVEERGAGDYPYFDDAPISLIFDCWIDEVARALGKPLDPRRWRPNLYAHAAEDFAFAEEQLVGRTIEVGAAVLRVRSTIERCVTTTYDVVTGKPDPDVLAYVAEFRNSVLGLYCDVTTPGTVHVTDALTLSP